MKQKPGFLQHFGNQVFNITWTPTMETLMTLWSSILRKSTPVESWRTASYFLWANHREGWCLGRFVEGSKGSSYFLSSYGSGPTLEVYHGKLEVRAPFLYILVPDWFRERYPLGYNYLEDNAKKLTSHFDLHGTLHAILRKEFFPTYLVYNRGVSLFHPNRDDRSCEDAGVPVSYCLCGSGEPVNKQDPTIQKIANISLQEINKLVSTSKNCSKLSLKEIGDSRYFNVPNGKQTTSIYLVVFQTSPGNSFFLSTVSCVICTTDFRLDDKIQRLGAPKQPSCTEDKLVSPYCYCPN